MQAAAVFISGWAIGLIVEVAYKSRERKILYRPRLASCQLYAYTAVLLYFLYFWPVGLLYKVVVISVFTTGLEYLVGYYLLRFQHFRDWDYSGCSLNYKGLICFKFSLLWLLLSLMAYYTLIPFMVNLTF